MSQCLAHLLITQSCSRREISGHNEMSVNGCNGTPRQACQTRSHTRQRSPCSHADESLSADISPHPVVPHAIISCTHHLHMLLAGKCISCSRCRLLISSHSSKKAEDTHRGRCAELGSTDGSLSPLPPVVPLTLTAYRASPCRSCPADRVSAIQENGQPSSTEATKELGADVAEGDAHVAGKHHGGADGTGRVQGGAGVGATCSKKFGSSTAATARDGFCSNFSEGHSAAAVSAPAPWDQGAVCAHQPALQHDVAPVSAAAYRERPMARGAVFPWPGLDTAAAYTVMTNRNVMNTCSTARKRPDAIS